MILYFGMIFLYDLLFGSPPGFITENDSLTDWCSMIYPLRWFPFNIKKSAGIVMLDLPQLWPAHRNDALINNFTRLRRVPAVWCSKNNLFIWHQLNIRQSAEKSSVKVQGSLSHPTFRYDYDHPFGMTAQNRASNPHNFSLKECNSPVTSSIWWFF